MIETQRIETVEIVLRLITAASTLLLGVAASIIAYQQFRINRSKLKLDLYDRRLAIYKELNEHISDISGKGWDGMHIVAAAALFYTETLEHKFLFDEDVVAYFELVHKEAGRLARAKLAYEKAEKSNDTTKLQETKEKIDKLEDWFDNQITDMYEVFQKDLSIKSLR